MSPTFTSMHVRNYRLYATGGFVSNIGTWMQRVAQDWLVLQLSGHSGVAQGITTGLQFLPMLLLAPFAGTVADRFSKRKVLMLTQASMALVGAVLGLLDITGVVRELDESQMSMMAQGMQSMQAMQSGASAPPTTDYGLLAHGQGIGSFANFFATSS